ncbi:MAG: CDP-alcohol phosphatidyltransferase family protein [Lapillicoccus sp.]
MTPTYRETLLRLRGAQKGAARSAPAYSRFVNRRLGRYLAALAFQWGWTANQVTAVSALWTYTGVALLVLVPVSWWLGVAVSGCLVLGYALDSADGQVARLTGSGGPAGEWLDHMVDAVKVVALPLALAVGAYRFDAQPRWWLVVPMVNAVASSVLFFGMMLTEQLRRQHGVRSVARTGGRAPWLRSVLVLPADYGVMCLSFLLLGATTVFGLVYVALTAALLAFCAAAAGAWFRQMGRLSPPRSPERTRVPAEGEAVR